MLALTWRGHPYGLAAILGPLFSWPRPCSSRPGAAGPGLGDLIAVFPHISPPFYLRPSGLGLALFGLLALMMLYAFLRAGLYPMWACNAIATWGCKAKIFYATRGVDLTWIHAHNYYPNLLPLLFSHFDFCLGRINDHLVQGLFPIWGALLLGLLFSLARRLGLSRTRALGLTAFLGLNGTVFIVHLYIAYADLPLAFFTLGAAGLLYLWLADQAPPGSLALTALLLAGMAWCKYEGPPLAATLLLAAALTLIWLRPPGFLRRLLLLSLPAAGIALGLPPLAPLLYPATPPDRRRPRPGLLSAATRPGRLVPGRGPDSAFRFRLPLAAVLLAGLSAGRRLWTSPTLFLALFLAGNLLAIILAYGLAPTSAAEFPSYVRATLDRLLLHLTPTAALLVGLGLKTSEPVRTKGIDDPTASVPSNFHLRQPPANQ